MGLTRSAGALAIRRIHVLVAPVAGWDLVRMQVQAAARRRGWALVHAPADADLLVTVGAPGDEHAALIERIWEQMPAPRWRVAVHRAEDIEPGFQEVAGGLRDQASWPRLLDAQTSEQARADPPGESRAHDGSDPARAQGSQEATADDEMPESGEMHGREGHGHGEMDMSMSMEGPGGIPLASGFEGDRDGLEMDVLHLPLGPVLPDWPPGLVLECTLSGDLVVEASGRLLPAASPAPLERELPPERQELARHLDTAAQILRIAGWPLAADRAVRLLDATLDGGAPADVLKQVEALRRRVARSRLLTWSLGTRRRGAPLASVQQRLSDHLAAAAAITTGRQAPGWASTPLAPFAETTRGRSIDEVRLLAAGTALQPAGSVVHHG